MWIFCNDSMMSIVADKDNPNKLLVRARIAGDIERVFPDAEVFESWTSDYNFRAYINRDIVADTISDRLFDIEYTNFKDSIDKTESARKSAYLSVWSIMLNLQDRLLTRLPWYERYGIDKEDPIYKETSKKKKRK